MSYATPKKGTPNNQDEANDTSNAPVGRNRVHSSMV